MASAVEVQRPPPQQNHVGSLHRHLDHHHGHRQHCRHAGGVTAIIVPSAHYEPLHRVLLFAPRPHPYPELQVGLGEGGRRGGGHDGVPHTTAPSSAPHTHPHLHEHPHSHTHAHGHSGSSCCQLPPVLHKATRIALAKTVGTDGPYSSSDRNSNSCGGEDGDRRRGVAGGGVGSSSSSSSFNTAMSNDGGKRSYSENSEDGGESGEVTVDWLKGEILSAIGGSAHFPLFSSPLRLERRRTEKNVSSSSSCGGGGGGGSGESSVDWERKLAASCTVYWVARFSDEVNERAAALTKVGDVRGDAAIIVHTAGAAAAAQAEELLNTFLHKRGHNRRLPEVATRSPTRSAASAAAALNAARAPPPRVSRSVDAGASRSAVPVLDGAAELLPDTPSSKNVTKQTGQQGVSEAFAAGAALLEPSAAVGEFAVRMTPGLTGPPTVSATAVAARAAAAEATPVSAQSPLTYCSRMEVSERAAASTAPAAKAATSAPDGLSVAQTLAPDVLVRVFTFLEFADLAACCQVCMSWRSAILDDELLLADARITRKPKTPISTSVRGVAPSHPSTINMTVSEASSSNSSSSNTRDVDGVRDWQVQQHLPHQRLQHLHPSLRQKILAAMRAAKPIPAIIIRAAHAGNAAAMAWYAEALDEGGEHHRALEWYRKAARSGHQASQYMMGVAYYRGDGDWIRDEEEALSWLLRCVKNPEEDRQLCAAAALLLGYMYLDGEGTARVSIEDAIKWLKLARDLGSKEAEETVGWLWNTGQY